MRNFKIWLFFSNTGGGHRSASAAIEAALKEVTTRDYPQSNLHVMMDAVVERSHPINKFFVNLYNYLLSHHQSWVKYYYWFLHATKPNNSALGYRLIKPFLAELFGKDLPDVVVSVHPMMNQVLVRARSELGSKQFKLIVVVTDPNKELWRGWAAPEADLTIAPNDLAKDKLVSWGVPPEKIRVLGMPIHPKFLRPATHCREETLTKMGLLPDRFTVCVNSGWAGGGNMMKIYKQLWSVKRPIQVVFLCGHNPHLLEQVRACAQDQVMPTSVLPFHENMVDVMNACDLMITKAGGLTTFEAIAKRLPIAFDVLTEPMPQESGTVEMLLEEGLAFAIKRPHDVVPIVESLNVLANREKQPLPRAHSLDQTCAAYNIAHVILSACEPSADVVTEAAPQWVGDGIPVQSWETTQLGLEGT